MSVAEREVKEVKEKDQFDVSWRGACWLDIGTYWVLDQEEATNHSLASLLFCCHIFWNQPTLGQHLNLYQLQAHWKNQRKSSLPVVLKEEVSDVNMNIDRERMFNLWWVRKEVETKTKTGLLKMDFRGEPGLVYLVLSHHWSSFGIQKQSRPFVAPLCLLPFYGSSQKLRNGLNLCCNCLLQTTVAPKAVAQLRGHRSKRKRKHSPCDVCTAGHSHKVGKSSKVYSHFLNGNYGAA